MTATSYGKTVEYFGTEITLPRLSDQEGLKSAVNRRVELLRQNDQRRVAAGKAAKFSSMTDEEVVQYLAS